MSKHDWTAGILIIKKFMICRLDQTPPGATQTAFGTQLAFIPQLQLL